jgi:hypothetical protein
LRQRRVGRFVRKILLTSEEAQERTTLLRRMIADGAAEHRVARFEGIEHGTLRDRPVEFEHDLVLALEVRQGPQVMREFDADRADLSLLGRGIRLAFT